MVARCCEMLFCRRMRVDRTLIGCFSLCHAFTLRSAVAPITLSFPANPGVVLCPSVGRVITRSADLPEGHYTLSGNFAAIGLHVLVTADHVCFHPKSHVQYSLKVLWRPAVGDVVILTAAVVVHDAEMDVAVLVVLDSDAPVFTPLPIADASIINANTSGLLCAAVLFPVSRDHRCQQSTGQVAALPLFEKSEVMGVDALGNAPMSDAAAAAAAAAPSYLVGAASYDNDVGHSGGAVVGLNLAGQSALLGIHTDKESLGAREEVQVESGDSEYEPSATDEMSTDSNPSAKVTQRELQQLTADAALRPVPSAGPASASSAAAPASASAAPSAAASAAAVVPRRASASSSSSASSAASRSGRSLFLVAHSAFARRGWNVPQLIAAAAQQRAAHAQAPPPAAAPAAPFRLITRSGARIQQRASPELFSADGLYDP
jgi:hypothetical protein